MGAIRNVRFEWPRDRESHAGMQSAAQRAGLRYEELAQDFLRSLGYWSYAAWPRIWFTDDVCDRYVVPDGLFVHDGECWDRKFLVVVEIKISHMPEAWWQLKRLYEPVLRASRPRTPVRCLEVVKSYDPAMPFPCEVELVGDIREWIKNPGERFAVYQWTP